MRTSAEVLFGTLAQNVIQTNQTLSQIVKSALKKLNCARTMCCKRQNRVMEIICVMATRNCDLALFGRMKRKQS